MVLTAAVGGLFVAVVVLARLPVTVEEVLAELLTHHLVDGADPAARDDPVQASHSRLHRPRAHRAVVVAGAGSVELPAVLDQRVVVDLRVRGWSSEVRTCERWSELRVQAELRTPHLRGSACLRRPPLLLHLLLILEVRTGKLTLDRLLEPVLLDEGLDAGEVCRRTGP